MTGRTLISGGSEYERIAGYSRAVVDGDWVFVAGTTGFDYEAGTISPDVAEQARQTFRTIASVLAKAGAGLSDVVRARYYITDASFWDALYPVLGEVFGEIRPAATCVVCGLIDPHMKVEIEVTARVRGRSAYYPL